MNSLTDEGMVDVGGIGMKLTEVLLSRGLHATWEQRLITEDSLWVLGVTEQRSKID